MHESHRSRLQETLLIALLTIGLAALAQSGDAQTIDIDAQAQQALQAEQAGLAADQAVGRAQQQLAAAEHALETGRTPLPGERRGNVDGYSRLLPTYFARIDALKQSVDAAKQKLNEANEARNALR